MLCLPRLSQGRPRRGPSGVQYCPGWVFFVGVARGRILESNLAIQVEVGNGNLPCRDGNGRHSKRSQFVFLAITQGAFVYLDMRQEFDAKTRYQRIRNFFQRAGKRIKSASRRDRLLLQKHGPFFLKLHHRRGNIRIIDH